MVWEIRTTLWHRHHQGNGEIELCELDHDDEGQRYLDHEKDSAYELYEH